MNTNALANMAPWVISQQAFPQFQSYQMPQLLYQPWPNYQISQQAYQQYAGYNLLHVTQNTPNIDSGLLYRINGNVNTTEVLPSTVMMQVKPVANIAQNPPANVVYMLNTSSNNGYVMGGKLDIPQNHLPNMANTLNVPLENQCLKQEEINIVQKSLPDMTCMLNVPPNSNCVKTENVDIGQNCLSNMTSISNVKPSSECIKSEPVDIAENYLLDIAACTLDNSPHGECVKREVAQDGVSLDLVQPRCFNMSSQIKQELREDSDCKIDVQDHTLCKSESAQDQIEQNERTYHKEIVILSELDLDQRDSKMLSEIKTEVQEEEWESKVDIKEHTLYTPKSGHNPVGTSDDEEIIILNDKDQDFAHTQKEIVKLSDPDLHFARRGSKMLSEIKTEVQEEEEEEEWECKVDIKEHTLYTSESGHPMGTCDDEEIVTLNNTDQDFADIEEEIVILSDTDQDSGSSSQREIVDQHPSGRLYRCNQCTHINNDVNDFVEHLRLEHGWIASSNNTSTTKVPAVKPNSHRASHLHLSPATCICGTCPVSFGSPKQVYKCDECGYTTKRKRYWEQHLKMNLLNGHVFQCTECEYSAKIKDRFTRHVKMHHNPNPELYRCAQCDYTTKCKEYLPDHIIVNHSANAKVYRCSKCDYKTKLAKYLAKHKYSKHVKRKFKCTQCDYAAKLPAHLRNHVKVKHDPNAKVYKCTECNFTSKLLAHFNSHIKSKHKSNKKKG